MEAKTVLNERKMSNYIDQGLKDTYGHGQCASLAMAVLEHLKLPCVVFYKTDPSDDSAIHVANAVDGGFLDIYGIVTHADLEKRYGCELRAVYDLKGEDTSIQFEVCMGQWTDDENDPYGAKRAWKDCGAEMRRNVQGPSGEFVRDGKVREREYQVEVCYGELGSGENYPLGTWKGMAVNHDDAERKALDKLWDSRLDSASCSPRVHVSCTAYESTVEDVENVLRSNSLAVGNTNGKSFEAMANELHGNLDFDLIEQAALAGDDLDEQTDYANDEIARQLREMGILEPLKQAQDSPSPGM